MSPRVAVPILMAASAWAHCTWAHSAEADDSELPPSLRGVGLDQRLNESLPLDLVFRDELGRSVAIAEYFDGKPVVLVFAYYRCPMLCTLVLNGLADSLKRLSFNVGDEFVVIAVSFDPRETPELAAAKKQAYVERYGRADTAHGWHFLTGDAAAIERLTDAAGFRYTYDAKRDQFAHASGIVVLTPQGKIARYFFGVEFPPRDLRLALVEASANRIGSPIDQAMLFCFQYDPATGKYTAVAMNFVRLGGAATIFGLAVFIVRMWRREKRVTQKLDVGWAESSRPTSSP